MLAKNDVEKTTRLSFEHNVNGTDMAELRAVLKRGDKKASETWLFAGQELTGRHRPKHRLRCRSRTSGLAGHGAPAWQPARGARSARIFVFGLPAAASPRLAPRMYEVISPVNVTALQVLFASFFALTFAWISFSCASAILGFFVLLRGNARSAALPATPGWAARRCSCRSTMRTPSASSPRSRAWAEALQARALPAPLRYLRSQRHAQEPIAAARSRRPSRPGSRAAGRRWASSTAAASNNHHRKAGNIADFVTRWGGAYDHMIVLDADSDMSGEAMVTLARAMAADPEAGIIQSLPLLQQPLDALRPHDAVRRPRLWPGGRRGPVACGTGAMAITGATTPSSAPRAFADAGGLPELHRAASPSAAMS